MTSTGFATADYEVWAPAAVFILILLMFVGGCAGSTGGGMKIFCQGIGEDYPDVTGASRAMKSSEFELCSKNGVTDIPACVAADRKGKVLKATNKTTDLEAKRQQLKGPGKCQRRPKLLRAKSHRWRPRAHSSTDRPCRALW